MYYTGPASNMNPNNPSAGLQGLGNGQIVAGEPIGAATKFWGVWLPVPTALAIINSIFWTWLILSTVGFQEAPLEKAVRWIIDQF